MKLIPNAGRVALRAHSMWGQYLALLTLVIPNAIYGVWGVDTNPYLWGKLAVIFSAYGIAGRVIDQAIDSGGKAPGRRVFPLIVAFAAVAIMALSGMSRWQAPAAPEEPAPAVPERAFLDVAGPLVARWEGKRNEAYLDRIASPPVWTVCYGETRGVGPGDRHSDAECLEMLEAGLLEYRAGLHGYFTDETLATRLPPTRDAAYTSLAWNVGIRGAGKSTATRRLNAGDIAGGCEALTWWNKAGGRVVRGLVRRRAEEREYCLRGLA